jgi:hypothetical protein
MSAYFIVTSRALRHLGRVELVSFQVPLSHFSGGGRTHAGDAKRTALGARKYIAVSVAIGAA